MFFGLFLLFSYSFICFFHVVLELISFFWCLLFFFFLTSLSSFVVLFSFCVFSLLVTCVQEWTSLFSVFLSLRKTQFLPVSFFFWSFFQKKSFRCCLFLYLCERIVKEFLLLFFLCSASQKKTDIFFNSHFSPMNSHFLIICFVSLD